MKTEVPKVETCTIKGTYYVSSANISKLYLKSYVLTDICVVKHTFF